MFNMIHAVGELLHAKPNQKPAPERPLRNVSETPMRTAGEKPVHHASFSDHLDALHAQNKDNVRINQYGNAFCSSYETHTPEGTKEKLINDWFLKRRFQSHPTWPGSGRTQEQLLLDRAWHDAVGAMPLSYSASADDVLKKIDSYWKGLADSKPHEKSDEPGYWPAKWSEESEQRKGNVWPSSD